MDLKRRRAKLEQELQRAQAEAAGWMQRVQQVMGALSENQEMQREEDTNGHGDAGVGQPAGGKAGPPV